MRESEEEMTQSEFGSGIVTCLAKFTEHLWDGGAYTEQIVNDAIRWTKMEESEQNYKRQEAKKFPKGDSAIFLQNVDRALLLDVGNPEQRISSCIEMWMNAASDHFYDLDERAPEPLKELAALTLRIGHGFRDDETYDEETVKEIHRLWKESCLAVDKMLGIEADWGAY